MTLAPNFMSARRERSIRSPSASRRSPHAPHVSAPTITRKISSGSSHEGDTTSTWPPKLSKRSAAAAQSSATSGSTRAYPRSGDHATLSPAMPPSHASRYERPAAGSECRSRSSGPAITSSISAASRTVRVSGPVWESVSQPGKPGACGTRPNDGLSP